MVIAISKFLFLGWTDFLTQGPSRPGMNRTPQWSLCGSADLCMLWATLSEAEGRVRGLVLALQEARTEESHRYLESFQCSINIP